MQVSNVVDSDQDFDVGEEAESEVIDNDFSV